MNPLNFQLCKLLLPSQLTNTSQQKTSLKTGHLLKSPINSIAPGWERNATEQLPAAPAHPYYYLIYEKESKPKVSFTSHLFVIAM